jgi:5-methylcytosine-specific restriction endonuclease McrA
MAHVTRICLQCDTEFTAYHANRKYCGQENCNKSRQEPYRVLVPEENRKREAWGAVTQCRIDGCERKKPYIKGLCKYHYNIERKTGDPLTPPKRQQYGGRKAIAPTNCGVNLCENLAEWAGLCGKHYRRQRNGHAIHEEPIEIPKPPKKLPVHGPAAIRFCSLKECDNPLEAQNYCSRHYQTLLKYGDPLHPNQRLIQNRTYSCYRHGKVEPYLTPITTKNGYRTLQRACPDCRAAALRASDRRHRFKKAVQRGLVYTVDLPPEMALARSIQEKRRRRSSNLEAFRARDRERDLRWRQKNPEHAAAVRRGKNARRKARIRGAGVMDLTRKQWEAILDVYQGKCAYCGTGGRMTMDHVIPISKGGHHSASNIVSCCVTCNSTKVDKIIDFFPYPLFTEHPARSRRPSK